jgi:hypothetical protein
MDSYPWLGGGMLLRDKIIVYMVGWNIQNLHPVGE